LSLPAGLLLAACFFFPAVQGCEDSPIIPFREVQHLENSAILVWVYVVPYLWGLLAVVAMGIGLLRAARPKEPLLYCLIAASLSLPCLGFLVFTALSEKGKERIIGAVLSAPAAWLFGKLIASTASRSDRAAQIARVIWCASLMDALWFGYWLLAEKPLYGLWLSFFAALALAAGGLLSDQRANERDAGPIRDR
jgi:hypothetical protein